MIGGTFADAARAFVWSSVQGLRALNTLIPNDSGVTLKSALDIDDAGDIVGRADTRQELDVGFLLQPQQ